MKKKGTIIYIGGFELPDKNAAAHRVLNNAKMFRDIGFSVVLIGINRRKKYFNQASINTKSIIQGFDCYSVTYPTTVIQWYDYLSNINKYKEIFKLYPNLEVVICYDFQALALFKLYNYCRKIKTEFAVDCCEWYTIKGEKLIFKIAKGVDIFFRMRVIQKKISNLIVISHYLEKYYSKSENVIIIPPLVDTHDSKWDEHNLIVNEREVHIVYAGSPGRNKDKIDLIIQLLVEIDGNTKFVFDIIGITKEEYILNNDRNKNLINCTQSSVNFHGILSHIECIEYIKNADFSIFLRDESRLSAAGFPTKFVESITCGTPIITNKTSDLSDYLQEGKNGYFIDLKDHENMILKLTEILNSDQSQRLFMKKFCKESKLFDYRNYIEITDNFLSKIIDKS